MDVNGLSVRLATSIKVGPFDDLLYRISMLDVLPSLHFKLCWIVI